MRVWWRRLGESASFGRAAPQWDPCLAAMGEGVGTGSTEGQGHRGPAAELGLEPVAQRMAWRFLSWEVAGESGVPGSCLDR